MADTVNAVVGAITNGVKWVRQKYRQFKVWVAEQLIIALEKGWTAALTIAALMAASIVVGYVWEVMKNNAVVVAVRTFVQSVAAAVKRFAAFLQIDLLLTLVSLGVLVNERLSEQLAPLYEELGNFAEELQLDVSYISTFIEVDRAMLQASYSLTGMGWVRAGSEFASGLSDWLSRLRGRLAEYAADPQKIFLDIQKEIAAERVKAASEELSRIWAAIDTAGEWIQGKGEIVIALVGEIDAQVAKMPQDIQAAIKPWWEDVVSRVDAFRDQTWAPFWRSYNELADHIEDVFLIYGSDIAELKRRIDDPADWLRSLLALPENEQATIRESFEEFFAQFLPVEESSPAAVATAAVNTFAAVDGSLADLAAAAAAASRGTAIAVLPDLPSVTVDHPWYEEKEP
jgi:hypothetical protein